MKMTRKRKQQFVAIRIVDLDYIVTPPRFPSGNGAFDNFASEFRQAVASEFDEQAPLVRTPSVLA